ncbi:MAG: ABC transporter permease [Clostridia bacterium]|nr:ABC transporter permease [Clostridia bacterium]
MHRAFNFFKRNLKEIFRDPVIYIFCLGFPLVMLILFYALNKFTNGNTLIFELQALLPGVMLFSYSFVMLTLGLIVSKDRQTFFLKRLYSSPMKVSDFIFGYVLVGVLIGILQIVLCFVAGLILSISAGVQFLSVGEILLLTLWQMPMLIMNVFLGVLFGTLFNDKTAPGICSVFISFAGILGGCWMPIESMGAFETFCRCLPFYPSVYIGRVITNAQNSFGVSYAFDNVALLGIVPIALFMGLSILLTVVAFKKNIVSDH